MQSAKISNFINGEAQGRKIMRYQTLSIFENIVSQIYNISLPLSIALHCLWNLIKLIDLLSLPPLHFIRLPLYVGKSGEGTNGQLFYMQSSICQEKHDYSDFEKKFLGTWLTCTTKNKAFRGNQKPLLDKTLCKDNIKRW